MGSKAAVNVAGIPYAISDARLVIAGYAFGNQPFSKEPPDPPYGSPLNIEETAVFAYRSYDCVPAGSQELFELTDLDFLVADGLNGRIGSRAMAGFRQTREYVNEALGLLSRHPPFTFWDLDKSEIKDMDQGASGEDSRLWGLYRAWFVLMSSPNSGVALTHKVLHHRLPHLVPLLDNETAPRLGTQARSRGLTSAWAQIHEDLALQASEFADLEDWFQKEATSRSLVPLTRLRLHDILLWCAVTGKRERAEALGRSVLSSESA